MLAFASESSASFVIDFLKPVDRRIGQPRKCCASSCARMLLSSNPAKKTKIDRYQLKHAGLAMAQGGYLKRREDSLEEIRIRQAHAAERRRELLERMKAQQTRSKAAETKQFPSGPETEKGATLDVGAAMSAAESIHLMSFEAQLGEPADLSRPTLALLQRFFEALSRGVSASVLQWPFSLRDVSILHPLAMAALLRVSEKKTTGDYAWCDRV